MTLRFGMDTQKMPDEIAFGDWGRLETASALDAFQDALEYFDREDVRSAEKQRQQMILAARRYHAGNHVRPLKIDPGQPDDNVLVNLCRSLVDDSVSWLFGNPETGVLQMKIVLDEDGQADDGGEDATTFLHAAYEAAGGFNFLKRLGMRGSIAGHFFIKIVNQDGLPRPVVLDPMITSVRTDPADADQVIAYKIEWTRSEAEPFTRRKDTYIYRQLAVLSSDSDAAWLVGDFKTKDRTRRKWELVQIGGWPYPWSPIVDGPNIEAGWGYYGLSDMEDVGGLNDAINFLSSNTMRILKFHAHPKTVGIGMDVGDLQSTDIDGFWTVPSTDARITNLEMQSDLGSSMAFLDFLKTSFWGIGRGLDPSTFKDKIGQVTNFALRVLAVRGLHKTGDKRQSYGHALRKVNSHMLEMAGFHERDTVIQWPDPLPEDPDAKIKNLSAEIAIGITSRQTASELAGRSWDMEQRRIRTEREAEKSLGQYLLEQFDSGLMTESEDEDAATNTGAGAAAG